MPCPIGGLNVGGDEVFVPRVSSLMPEKVVLIHKTAVPGRAGCISSYGFSLTRRCLDVTGPLNEQNMHQVSSRSLQAGEYDSKRTRHPLRK